MYDLRWLLVGKFRNLSRERFKTASGINPVRHCLDKQGNRTKKNEIWYQNTCQIFWSTSVLPRTALCEVLHRGKLVQFLLECSCTSNLLLFLQSSQIFLFSQLGKVQRDVGITRKKVMRCYAGGRIGIIQNAATNISVQAWLLERKRLRRIHGYDK